MISSKQYIIQIIARLNVVTVPQLLRACCGTVSRSAVYRSSKWLIENGYLKRISHPKSAYFGLQATPKAQALVYGDGDRRIRAFRERDLTHSIACSDAAIGLSFYPNIRAMAFSEELSPEEIVKFSLNRPRRILPMPSGRNRARKNRRGASD